MQTQQQYVNQAQAYMLSMMCKNMTMVGGRILYECFDGRQHYHLTDNTPERIYEDCAAITDRIIGPRQV